MKGLFLVFQKVVLGVAVMVLAGYLVGKKADRKTLASLSIYLLTPALLIYSFHEDPELFSFSSLNVVLYTIIFNLILVGLSYFLGGIFFRERESAAAFALLVFLPNTGNFGLPINLNAFGERGMALASLVLVIFILMTHTLGVAIASFGKEGKIGFSIRKIFQLPVFYVVVLSLIYREICPEFPLPDFLENPIKIFAFSAIGLNLIQLGVAVRSLEEKPEFKMTILSGTFRLIVVPAMVLATAPLFGIRGLMLKVLVLQEAMPPAIYNTILSSFFDLKPGKVAFATVWLTIISLLTLTMWVYFLQNFV